MVRLWFDAFRENGAPSWYGDHRTSVNTDLTTTIVVIFFATLFTTFLFIFPGVRQARWTSFISLTQTLLVGSAILAAQSHPSWHEAEISFVAPFRSFSSQKMEGVLGVKIGLTCANVTLIQLGGADEDTMLYNERFFFTEMKTMQSNLVEALRKGLPYPIITIIEYMSVDKAGFLWGRGYRLAGYYTNILLWLSFSLWIAQLFVLCLLPRYFSRVLVLVGAALLLTDLVYMLSCPQNLAVPFFGLDGLHNKLMFKFGWCFWLTLAAGMSCVVLGAAIRLMEHKSMCQFTTFLQIDYDEMSTFSATETSPALSENRKRAALEFFRKRASSSLPDHQEKATQNRSKPDSSTIESLSSGSSSVSMSAEETKPSERRDFEMQHPLKLPREPSPQLQPCEFIHDKKAIPVQVYSGLIQQTALWADE